MANPIKIIIVEHSAADIELIEYELAAANIPYHITVVQNEESYIDALSSFNPDIILSDFSLPSFDGPTAFSIRQKLAIDVPFIFVSGNIGEEKSIEYIKAGVTDYVLKDKMFTLGSKVNRALTEAEEKRQKMNTDKALGKANRLYAFISKINQTIVHITEEKLLFETACQIAVEFGKFEIAWIGLLDETTKTVSICGHNGIADEDISLFKNIPYHKHGPQQHMITTGSYFVCNNIVKDFSLDSWKPLADKYGIHSFVVLPIKRGGAIVGSLSLYASEYDFFDRDEMALLVEIAADISFAIDMMDNVKRQRETEMQMAFKAELLNTIGQAVIATDLDGTVNFWNKAAENLYGWHAHEAIGKNMLSLIPTQQTKKQADEISKKLLLGQTWSGEFTVQRKDTRTFPVFVTYSPVYDQQHKLSGIIGVSFNITQRKKAEATLLQSELRYRSLIEQATDAICITDKSLHFTEINPYACEIFGYTRKEGLALSLPDILFGEDLADNPLKIEDLEQGKIIRNERRLKKKDGTGIDMEVSTKIISDGRLIMFGHDITERKKAEQAISKSEKQYRQIVETAQEGIWMVDEKNKTTFVNKKMCDMLEYSEAELMGRTIMSFRDTQEQNTAAPYTKPNKNGRRESNEAYFITKNKKRILTLVSTNAIISEDGSYKGALAMITDITEKIKLENLLNKASTMARIGSWEVDLLNDTVYYSDMTKEIHELESDFIPTIQTGMAFYKEGANRDRIEKTIQAAIEHSTSWDEELEIITAKGNERWIRSIGKTESANGKCIRMNGSFQDITARKKDEIQLTALNESLLHQTQALAASNDFLAASEKSYSDLFQLSPQPMCLYEMGSFKFIQVNQAAINQYGYSKDEFLTMTLLDLVPEEDRIKAIAVVAGQNRVMNKTYTSQAKNHKKNGDVIEVETFSTPIIINGGPTTLVMAVDVTEKNLFDHKIIKAIIKTQEDERYEIGGELHDNVCQILAASQIRLGMLKMSLPPESSLMLEQCMQYITLASEEIRNLSHRLAPVFFEESTMEEAFKKLFHTFAIADTMNVVLDFDDSVTKFPLSLEIQLNLYRILQEQLRNILKYAAATVVEVDVIVYNNKLKMRISDNGIGFNLESAKNGIGLANMKRRAELFMGKFEIDASPGNGCTVLIDIPL